MCPHVSMAPHAVSMLGRSMAPHAVSMAREVGGQLDVSDCERNVLTKTLLSLIRRVMVVGGYDKFTPHSWSQTVPDFDKIAKLAELAIPILDSRTNSKKVTNQSAT